MKAALLSLLPLSLGPTPCALSFAPSQRIVRTDHVWRASNDDDDVDVDRRAFLSTAVVAPLLVLAAPRRALAGIDVSGLRVEGGGDLSERVRTLERAQTTTTTSVPRSVDTEPLITGAATNVRRTSTSRPDLRRTGPAGTLAIFRDTLVESDDDKRAGDGGGGGRRDRYLDVSFELPADWLQLDRVLGGIQFVDQRNGDKLYVLRAPAPSEGERPIPKQFYADAVFNPKGAVVVSSGIVVDEYRVSSATTLSRIGSCDDGRACAIDVRRLTIKYATVTGNGYRVERRALVDATEIKGTIYMMVTSSNAVKFDAKGPERETVENIVNSFRVQEV